jgi:exosortase/archaeosortase
MDAKLLSVERLIGLTMIIMGFLNILLSLQYDLDITPVAMFLFGVILFVHSSMETWHKWGVIGLAIAAGVVFKTYQVDPVVTYWYKQILFYGTIVTVIIFMLTHRIKSNP